MTVSEWAKYFKSFVNELEMPRDDYKGIMEYIDDALTMLKEQEAVAVHDPGAYCPKCGWMLYPEDHPHHCGNCGQAVKWDA